MNNDSNKFVQILTSEDRDALTDTLRLLLTTHTRVSSQKVTSDDPYSSYGRGLLDKLEIFLPSPVSPTWIREKCFKEGFQVSERYKSDKKLYLTVTVESQKISCLIGHPNNQEIKKIILNPSHCESYSHTEMNLLRLFGPSVLTAKVYRIDFTVDIFKDYSQVLKGLNVKHKVSNIEYIGGSIRTGLLVGANNDKIIIYNKAVREKSSNPWTRIERQISSSKKIKEIIGIKNLGELRDKWDEILAFNPLSIVTLNNIEFINSDNLDNQHKDRLNEAKALIKHEGYFLARKKLNANRNFERDYGRFFALTPVNIQPYKIFNHDITNYFRRVLQ